MYPDTALVPVPILKDFICAAFMAQGVPEEDAAVCADVLILADLSGLDTHGISRLNYYRVRLREGVTLPMTNIEVVRETSTTAVIDGHHGLGHVVGCRAMQMAIDKAREHGLGAVAVRNSTHYGMAGYYPQMAIDQDMVGLTTTNARPSVVPTFGTEPKFGTNPLSFGAPTDEDCPFLYDASVAVTQRGKLEVAKRAGTSMPDGLVIDEHGKNLNDPGQILEKLLHGKAAMLPLGGAGEERGGHKGYGLGIILEILSAALQGGSFLTGLSGGDKEGAWKKYNLGHFFLALNISAFTDIASFKKTTGDILRELRAARKAPGEDRIWSAGEKEWVTQQQRTRDGIPVNPELQRELTELRDELGLQEFSFPFDED